MWREARKAGATVVVATTGARMVFLGAHTPQAWIDVLLKEVCPSLDDKVALRGRVHLGPYSELPALLQQVAASTKS